MKCCVGVMTHNALSELRLDLLERTLESIAHAFPNSLLCAIDNGSNDGTSEVLDDLVRHLGPWHTRCYDPDDEATPWGNQNFTPGMGRNRLMSFMDQVCSEQWGVNHDTQLYGKSFFVWSDDDMIWRPGAEKALHRFWSAPEAERDGVMILSGLLEPEWHWNTPRRVVEAGGVRVLVRDSCPGAAWSFGNPRAVWPMDSELAQFGYDHKTCLQMLERGCSVAQIDLAEHIGWDASTHGNRAIEDSRPLDRDKWGV